MCRTNFSNMRNALLLSTYCRQLSGRLDLLTSDVITFSTRRQNEDVLESMVNFVEKPDLTNCCAF